MRCSFCLQLFFGLFQETQRYEIVCWCPSLYVLLFLFVCMFCVWCNAHKGLQVKGMENVSSSCATWALNAWMVLCYSLLPIKFWRCFVLLVHWAIENVHHGAMRLWLLTFVGISHLVLELIRHTSMLQRFHVSSRNLQRP